MLTYEVEKPKITDFFKRPYFGRESDILRNMKVVGSGKGAIALILKYLISKKIIENKMDEILVPDWLGYWVYNQMHPFIFPVRKISPRTKVIFVYHQYGFPQDMDKIMKFATEKKLIVIEDCAHALNSFYKGKRLGGIGDFSIYSFSKWFSCFALGGAKSRFSDFSDFAEEEIRKTPLGLTFYKDLTKYISEKSRFSNNQIFKKYASLFLQTAYSLYGEALKPGKASKNLLWSKIDNEIEIRQKRYKFFLGKTKEFKICDHLEEEGVTPYVIPIRVPEVSIVEILEAMNKKGIITSPYHFDINRNMLDPNFVTVILVPCHSGITDEQFAGITDLIIRHLKR